jgi:hypothetical protein
LYYLNSRYYNPEIGRYINANDVSEITPSSINGVNLYTYSVNNPVMVSAYTERVAQVYGTSAAGAVVSNGGGISSNTSPTANGLLRIGVGAIPDMITGAKYLLSTGIHNNFVYSKPTRYMFPILGGNYRYINKTGSRLKDFKNLTGASFRQIVATDAKAGLGAMFKSVGKTAGLTGVVNFGFNLYENNGQIDGDMLLDTGIDTAIGVSSYYLAAGTMSLIVAGIALTGVAIPGLVVVGGVVLLSVGYDYLIREITGYDE